MPVIARAGESIKDRDGKVIATVAQDIHTGDVNLRPNQFIFAKGHEVQGAFLPEDIMDFVRGRLSSGLPAADEPVEPKAEAPVKTKRSKKPR